MFLISKGTVKETFILRDKEVGKEYVKINDCFWYITRTSKEIVISEDKKCEKICNIYP